MKKIQIILFSTLIFFSFSNINYIEKYEKKIKKEMKKTFKKDDVSLFEFEFPEKKTGSGNSFYKIFSNDKLIGYANINRVNACRTGGCERTVPISILSYDHFYYMAVYGTDFSLLNISVLDYQSEHGYEICSKGWLKQFIGSNERTYVYNKNIDAISGATVSVNALIDEMNFVKRQLSSIKDCNNN